MKRLLPLVLVLFFIPVPLSAQTGAGPSLSDVAPIRDRYILSLLPSAPAAVAAVHAESAKYAASLEADGSWPDIDYTAQSPTLWVTDDHLERVFAMAQSARLERNAGHPDDALEDKAILALKWWTDHDYKDPNWWWNEIQVPQQMGEIGNLLAQQLSPAEIAKMIEIMKRSDWQHGAPKKWTGANLIWGVGIQIARGCLENDAATVDQGFSRMYQEIEVVAQNKQGIQQDDSFHQHGQQLYSGGYGMVFAVDTGRLILLARGTQFQISSDGMKIFLGYLLDGEQWIIRDSLADYSTRGRNITRRRGTDTASSESAENARGLADVVAAIATDPIPRQKEMQAFAAYLDKGAPGLIGNKQFWCSDFMVDRQPGYYASVKMLSNRMQNAELVNGEGKKSVHLSDGANYLYLTGGEYSNIFPAWDWTRIPGTTAIQGTLDTGEKNPIAVKGTTTFDGGVSDGAYGLAAMDLARGNLTAKKAWFFFDTSYVALGAGITLTDDTEHAVATDVNQTLLSGDVFTSQSSGTVPNGTQSFDPRYSMWVYHNHVGYIFPAHTHLSLFAGPRTGKWSDIGAGSSDSVTVPIFDLWIDHGCSPQGATYEYVVLPHVSRDEVARRAKSSDLAVLANTISIQAVYDRSLRLVQIAFREAGSLATPLGPIQVDHSCLLMVRQVTGGWKITASNPENQPLTLKVTVQGKQDEIQLPGGSFAGSSITADLR